MAAAGRTAVSCVLPGQPRLRARRSGAGAGRDQTGHRQRGDSGAGSEPSSTRPAVPPGTPDGAECAPLIVWTASS